MNEESQELFEQFIEQWADSRVIAVNGRIEDLINQILEKEKQNYPSVNLPHITGLPEWVPGTDPGSEML